MHNMYKGLYVMRRTMLGLTLWQMQQSNLVRMYFFLAKITFVGAVSG